MRKYQDQSRLPGQQIASLVLLSPSFNVSPLFTFLGNLLRNSWWCWNCLFKTIDSDWKRFDEYTIFLVTEFLIVFSNHSKNETKTESEQFRNMNDDRQDVNKIKMKRISLVRTRRARFLSLPLLLLIVSPTGFHCLTR